MGKPTAHNYASARHLSCEGCRTRKSKCSRTFPCVSCAVRGDDCIWLDTEPAHGVLQSSLEENFAEIRRLNKVVVQLQALLNERDGRVGGGGALVGYNNDTFVAAAIASGSRTLPPPPPSVVTPPTPPGLDYLPVALHPPAGLPTSSTLNPRVYDTTTARSSNSGMMMPGPPPPPMLRTQSDYSFGMGMMPPAPPMMLRTRSDYGYRFPSPTSHHDAAGTSTTPQAYIGATTDYAPPRYTLPSMYQQQQHSVQSEDSQEVLVISPSQLSSSPVMPPPHPNRTRSTTRPSLSSLVAADQPTAAATAAASSAEENPFALPLLFSSNPTQSQSQQQQRFQSTTNPSSSNSHHHHHHQPPPMSDCDPAPMMASSSPHSLKLDAAVTLAKGLAAGGNHRSFAMALDDDDDDDGDRLSQRHIHENGNDEDDDLYALPIPPPDCGPATATVSITSASTELAQLATITVSRQASVDFHPRPKDTGGEQALFAALQEKEGPGMLDSQQSSNAAGREYTSSSSAFSAPSIVTDSHGTVAEDPAWLFRLPQY